MVNIPVRVGFSRTRWQEATSVMLEKGKGQPKIYRLCIIHLFEAAYNLFLKLIWGSRMIARAERYGQLGDDMQGSRKHHSTMDVLFKKIIMYDISRQQRSPLAVFDNDAASCYDRILVNLAMVCARRLGVQTAAILAHAETLRQMKYMVKTVYGISERKYFGTDDKPLAGIGQGSGASPSVWLSLCIVLLIAYGNHAPKGMEFQDPTNTIESSRVGDAFLDDMTIGFNTAENSIILQSMVITLAKCAQLWEQLLFASGVELSKCYYDIIHWQWDEPGYPRMNPLLPARDSYPSGTYKVSEEVHVELPVLSGRDTIPTQIKHKPAWESSKSLGILSNPMGTWEADYSRKAMNTP